MSEDDGRCSGEERPYVCGWMGAISRSVHESYPVAADFNGFQGRVAPSDLRGIHVPRDGFDGSDRPELIEDAGADNVPGMEDEAHPLESAENSTGKGFTGGEMRI